MNVEVTPSPNKPPRLETRERTFSLDVLPDGSKMATFRLMYQSPGYEKNKPQLNQVHKKRQKKKKKKKNQAYCEGRIKLDLNRTFYPREAIFVLFSVLRRSKCSTYF